MKKVLCVAMAVLMMISCCVVASAKDIPSDVLDKVETYDDMLALAEEYNIPVLDSGIIWNPEDCPSPTVTIELEDGWTYSYALSTSTSTDDNNGFVTYGATDKTVTKFATGKLKSKSDGVEADVVAMITGYYSSVDRYSVISTFLADFGGTYANRFSYTSTISGNTATAIYKYRGKQIAKAKYKLNYNGALTQTAL